MIEICFEEKNDAVHVYRQLTKRTESLYKETSVYLNEQKVVIHIPLCESNYIEKILLPVLLYFIMNVKQNEWIHTILKEKFFYEEQEECHQILHMAHEILKERRKGVSSDLTRQKFESYIASSLKDWLCDPLSFSFSSYVRFRLRTYREMVTKLAEVAIDEYKMEQEYQIFIETLRQQVSSRKSRLSCVHLIFDESFIFYDDKGRRLKQEKLVQYIDEELLKKQDVYIDTKVIAPLLSISPKKIYLYTKEQDHNMIITLRNVFQERVQLHGLHEFERNVKNLKNKGNALDFLSF
ncbi:putative sporulation protein YtxC [Bacillus sp. TH22]|uniref:putative sporulation protein YtxC n=1 Tax=unclassified Bacillus (in: firmicutes) TaxID=185979 RepID=UPI00191236DF|nr:MULTISPECIES: putative sporulation protein YtxC [unclassified Bacillus (in: firmicutes)]MBK5357919.1 putative sporulation protein YtxC [Bacillus sp. TH44]MBK5349043.1 putative sporulation protein YtxC [Bacillus sp. TH45]MBK5364055.1 putative sporulation protein YtxC [Bacillus sp. TH50]MBK5450816.1 putative sporulation protein YtxC [Bacillus sp. TH22]MBK5455441.1 putative sporulation protein YtxC [Bacillus sp. TH23]